VKKSLITLLLLPLSFSVYADAIDSLITANCDSKIPVNVIRKLILHESKSVFNNKVQPWPWVLNVNGNPHYFNTQQKAIKAALVFVGNKSNVVDIGFGQVNWKYHKHRFDGDVRKTLDPRVNLSVVCEILSEALVDKRVLNWVDMVAYYHRTVLDKRAYRYAEKVFSG